MNSAEARELWEIIGRVMADSARDVASRTRIAPDRLIKTIARDTVLHQVTDVFLRANERGALPQESATEARIHLTHSLHAFILRGRASFHQELPRP
jgi:hypothetical protein